LAKACTYWPRRQIKIYLLCGSAGSSKRFDGLRQAVNVVRYSMKVFQIILILSFFGTSITYGQKYLDSLENAEQKAGKTVYWYYGLRSELEKDFAKSKVAQQYQFSFQAIAGCVLTKKIIRRINLHNAEVNNVLNKRLGSDWKSLFYKMADSVFLIDQTIINRFNRDTTLNSTFYKICEKLDNRIILRVLPTSDTSLYILRGFLMDQYAEATEKYVFSVEVRYPELSFGQPEY
jgi:hypothetical protein